MLLALFLQLLFFFLQSLRLQLYLLELGLYLFHLDILCVNLALQLLLGSLLRLHLLLEIVDLGGALLELIRSGLDLLRALLQVLLKFLLLLLVGGLELLELRRGGGSCRLFRFLLFGELLSLFSLLANLFLQILLELGESLNLSLAFLLLRLELADLRGRLID